MKFQQSLLLAAVRAAHAETFKNESADFRGIE